LGAETPVASGGSTHATHVTRDRLLWTGVLAGPVAWALELLINYALVKPACGRGWSSGPFNFVTIGALAIVLLGAAAAWRALAATPPGAATDGGHPLERSRAMAIYALASCAFFAVVVVAGAVPQWMLDACL
jgi:hypothetical protein